MAVTLRGDGATNGRRSRTAAADCHGTGVDPAALGLVASSAMGISAAPMVTRRLRVL